MEPYIKAGGMSRLLFNYHEFHVVELKIAPAVIDCQAVAGLLSKLLKSRNLLPKGTLYLAYSTGSCHALTERYLKRGRGCHG